MSAGVRGGDYRRHASVLLDQQLWCWGRDVVRPEGNLLLALGMCRYRAATAAGATSAYTGRVAGGTVWLWGFGVLYSDDATGGTVFLQRYDFVPKLVARPLGAPVYRSTDLPGLARPSSAGERALARTLVRRVAEWVARYEHWVAENHGVAYRRAALAARDRSPAVPAERMAAGWERVAKKAVRLDTTAGVRPGVWANVLTGLHRALRARDAAPETNSTTKNWGGRK
ncbi:MAG: hypothetical protein FJ304_10485 [Planctomycetes bacterium]|nr:hypothetical protein [Planctomycetota bacterium]